MAQGEKRLFQLINATVSHEMRNPANAIQCQVQELLRLNMKQKDTISKLSGGNLKESKKLLKKNLGLQEQSTSMQLSATKILCFLINDMLDYAQLSAGQFRKNFKRFDLISSINDILNVIRAKSDDLGITVNFDITKLVSESAHNQIQVRLPSNYFIFFDEQRL